MREQESPRGASFETRLRPSSERGPFGASRTRDSDKRAVSKDAFMLDRYRFTRREMIATKAGPPFSPCPHT
jgi:hypothetical protein